jgi:hypothetical protein
VTIGFAFPGESLSAERFLDMRDGSIAGDGKLLDIILADTPAMEGDNP